MADPEILLSRLDERIRDLTRVIDEQLDTIAGDADMPHNLREAMHYALLGGGKRLRPILVLICAEAVANTGSGGGRGAAERNGVVGDDELYDDLTLRGCAAMEMIHAFSLVHDDLPAMDDDDLRRGRPTLHRHTSEAMAILAGDVLLSHAMTVVAEAVDAPLQPQALLIREIAAATTAMIGGQVYDTLGGLPREMPAQVRLQVIHANKTAALICASCRVGAISAGADDHQLEALSRYGTAIGMMFQLADDLMDVTQSTEHTGKKTNKDIDAGKLTAPRVLGIKGTRAEIKRHKTDALAALSGARLAQGPRKDLEELCKYMAKRTR